MSRVSRTVQLLHLFIQALEILRRTRWLKRCAVRVAALSVVPSAAAGAGPPAVLLSGNAPSETDTVKEVVTTAGELVVRV